MPVLQIVRECVIAHDPSVWHQPARLKEDRSVPWHRDRRGNTTNGVRLGDLIPFLGQAEGPREDNVRRPRRGKAGRAGPMPAPLVG